MGMIVAGIPSNRPALCREAVETWKETKEFDEIWLMWDGPGTGPPYEFTKSYLDRVFHHSDIEPSCIPTGSGCCRSRLVLEAWRNHEVKWLVHLDDDVRPSDGGGTFQFAIGQEFPFSRWLSTVGRLIYARGHPYELRIDRREPKIVHGIWNGNPDFDAATQLYETYSRGVTEYTCEPEQVVMRYGHYFPMSSMAVAIHRDLFPASYFLWMGKDLPLNKYGDIWCGVILKKICDHFGWLVTSGAPVVHHERASNVWENLRQEAKAIEYNERWWEWVDAVDIRSCSTVAQCYRQIATQMGMPKTEAFEQLRAKMIQWIGLFS